MLYSHVAGSFKTSMFVLCAAILATTAGCGGSGSASDAASASATSASSTSGSSVSGSSSSSPSITGSPSTKALVGQQYSFTPTVQNTSGEAMGFSIQNKPAWATFSIATGSLSGTPSTSDVGTDSDIVISASNVQKSAALSPFNIAVTTASTSSPDSVSGGAKLAFNYPTGFSAAPNAISVGANDASGLSGNVINVTSGLVGQHEAGSVWYPTPQSIASFTTDFTFRIAPGGYGMTFVIQNDPHGVSASADSNGLGYFTYTYNNPDNSIANSVAIAFDATPNSTSGGYYIGPNPSVIGLYVDGGPFINNGILPVNDLTPQGINLESGDVMSAHVVYDGTLLSIELTDTSSGAKAYFSWPVDIPAAVGSSTAYVGFAAGTITAAAQTLNSWSWWQGYNSRLATPTFSPAPGSYTGSQSVTISGPSGATIYYTTNGKPPTTASSVYSGPITVGSNELIQAIAVQSGYTDSLPTQGNYEVQSSGSPPLNFPNGFATANGLVQTAGVASISGANLQLLDGANQSEIGSAFYAAPVNVQSFSTNFTLQFNGGYSHSGTVFVIQNQLAPSTTSHSWASGGIYAFGFGGSHLGYQGLLNSVGVSFDVWNGTIGAYTDGTDPSTGGIPISGITLSSGHPIACTLTYDGTTLSLSMEDTVTLGTFSASWPVNIPATVGAADAYIGFTSAAYDSEVVQDVTAWTYHN